MIQNIIFQTKKDKKKIKENYQEVLLENVLSSHVQSLLRPYNIILGIFFNRKYVIKDNFITPNNNTTNFIQFVGNFVLAAMLIHRSLDNFSAVNSEKSNIMDVLGAVFSVAIPCASCILYYVLNVQHGNLNVQIILHMQEIDKELPSDDKELRYFVIVNWAHCLINFGYLLINCMYMNWNRVFFPMHVFCDMSVCVLDLNMIYTQRVMKFLNKKLLNWSKQLKNKSTMKKLMKELELPRCDVIFNGKHYFEIYAKILDAYKYYKTVSPDMMFFYLIITFTYSLNFVYHSIIYCQLESDSLSLISNGSFMIIWLFKSMFYITTLCSECENFYTAVEDAESECTILATTTEASGEERRLNKNIVRLNRAQFSRMKACGVCVDACLPMTLLYQITSFTVVMLQFLLI